MQFSFNKNYTLYPYFMYKNQQIFIRLKKLIWFQGFEIF